MVYVGSKYYKYVGDETVVIRVMKFKNDKVVTVKNDATNEISNITVEDLENEYVLISFDGLMVISKVSIGGDKEDVIVSLYRRKEIDNKDGLPYIMEHVLVKILFQQELTLVLWLLVISLLRIQRRLSQCI